MNDLEKSRKRLKTSHSLDGLDESQESYSTEQDSGNCTKVCAPASQAADAAEKAPTDTENHVLQLMEGHVQADEGACAQDQIGICSHSSDPSIRAFERCGESPGQSSMSENVGEISKSKSTKLAVGDSESNQQEVYSAGSNLAGASMLADGSAHDDDPRPS